MADDAKIDDYSRMMLFEMSESDGPFTSSSLADVADLSQTTQVNYRMDQHLKPNGLVKELDRADGRLARQYRITEKGEKWVNHAERPESAFELSEEAIELVQELESRVEGLEKYMQNTSDWIYETDNQVEKLEQRNREVEKALLDFGADKKTRYNPPDNTKK